MAVLTIKALAKSFANAPAIRALHLDLVDGEFCVLAAPKRAGKTTLLRLVAGLEEADAGTIAIDGMVANGLQPRQRNVALMFGADAPMPDLSCHALIGFGLRAMRMPRRHIQEQVEQVAEAMGLADMLHQPVRGLTEPDRRRAAIARAVVREADVCMFDDPLAGLEPDERDAILVQLPPLHEAFPGTKLYATHDPIEAMALGERTLVMQAGTIEQDGVPAELFERPRNQFVAGFFGWPKMSFLPGVLGRGDAGDVVKLADDASLMALPAGRIPAGIADGRAIVLGIRPEHMVRAVRASPSDGMFRHDADIEAVRQVGPRAYATFRIGGSPLVAELLSRDVTAPGEKVPLDINLKRVSIFDAATGEAL